MGSSGTSWPWVCGPYYDKAVRSEEWEREKQNEPCAVEGHGEEEIERVRSVPMVEACLPPGAMMKSFCVPIKHKTIFTGEYTRVYPDFGMRHIS